MEPIRPRPPQPLPSGVPERPTVDMLQHPDPIAMIEARTKSLFQSRTVVAGLIIVIVNAVLGFFGIQYDATAAVDAVAAGQWIAFANALLGLLVIFFRAKAATIIDGIFGRRDA